MNNGIDLLKKQLQENIQQLIDIGKLFEAKELVEQYKTIVKDDVETYSIEAVIAIMQGKFEDAEEIINVGLGIEPYNKDLLFNLSYLMDNNKKYYKALECFCKAKLFNSNSNVNVRDIIPNFKPLSNNLEVVHGTMEIANQMNTVTKGLKKLGVDAKTINYYPNYLGYKADYTLNLNSFKDINEANIETKNLASKVIAENDVFHFHFGTSLTLDYSDLPLYKELNKKIIMQYWGSDVRLYSKAIKLNPYVKVKNINEDEVKCRIELIAKYIPNCLVDYELAEYVKDFHSNVYITRVAINLEEYKFVDKTYNEKFTIVHAPTSPEIKGTEYILKAIEDLRNKYDFDFKLVQNMSNDKAKKVYEKADLIVDQVLNGNYGVLAIESMAMGKPVICWISDFMKEKYPKELPVISANPNTIKDRIEYVLRNKDIIKELGKRGRIYVEKYHDMRNISRNMLEIYKKI